MARPVIEVVPRIAFDRRRRLFVALSDAFDVDIVAGPGSSARISGRVVLGGDVGRFELPTLLFGESTVVSDMTATIHFSESSQVPVSFRGWALSDRTIGSAALEDPGQATVLARVADRPVWTTEHRNGIRLDRSAVAPEELADSQTLLGRFTPEDFFGLLPLVHFLRTIDRPDAWSAPPLMASFIMDDPNLRSKRYGYLDFAELALQPFHTSVSTIPLDGWYIRPGVADLFRSHPESLSLMIHGNNHTLHELDDGRGDEARLRMLSQSLNRARRIASRSQVPIAEVMAAPHGRCSEESALDMASIGYESLCISRPFPWLQTPPGTVPLAGWFPADTSAPQPVLPRIPISTTHQILPLRAFLGQPIIVYGHHWDLADQPDVLHRWAADVARLGDVVWASVGSISRRMYSWRTDGETVLIRPHTRVVDVDLPEAARRVAVEAPPGPGYELVEAVSSGSGVTTKKRSEAEFSLGGGGSVTIRLVPEGVIDPRRVPAPTPRPWPVIRRALTEARDRSQPQRDSMRQRVGR